MSAPSTTEHLGPLVAGDEIGTELRSRKKKDVYQTVRGASSKLIAEKVRLEEADGWRVVRRNAKSTRMALPKPPDEQLEDEVWCLLAMMGFHELSQGRLFKVAVDKNLPKRQIDVFAKDDEAALVVECTHRTEPGTKRMTPLIEKLQAIRPGIIKSIRRTYAGNNVRPKLGYVIATRNIWWSDADLARCERAQITVLTDEELAYYATLVQHLRRAARYQFLAHVFRGQKVEGLATKVVATRGRMGGDKFYTFLLPPDELLKIAYVGHKGSRTVDALDTYQRMLKPLRLRKIAHFINEGGKFPTNLVLNLKTGQRSGRKTALRFDILKNHGDEALGTLHLPSNYASAWVIDGQHRLYGYAYARDMHGLQQDSTLLPVLAYENLPSDKEMNLFIDINSKQVKVSTNLLVELYANLHWNSPDPEEAFQALLARVATRLNSDSNSPLHDRMVVAGKKKNHFRCLTQTSVRDGLKVAQLLGSQQRSGLVAGPLSTSKPDDYHANLRKALIVLSECLRMFAKELPDHWQLGSSAGGYLCTNNGIRAVFHVIADVAEHLRLSDHVDLSVFSAEETFAELRPFFEALVDYFKGASAHEIHSFRRIPSSLTGVRTQAYGLGAQIHERIPSFRPPGLREYLESRDEAGTEEARGKVAKIELKLFEYVVATLKGHFDDSEEAWWTEGTPVEIRKECSGRWEEKDRKGQPEEQLFLVDYIKICHKNWELFKEVVALDEKDKGNKRACTRWIRQLNEVRQITSHPARGVLTTDQVAFVRDLSQAVERHFPRREER